MVVALVLLPAIAHTQGTASDANAIALALGLALLKVVGFVATALGAAAALYWGFSLEAALVFGLALSVASTVVLLGALQAAGGVSRC